MRCFTALCTSHSITHYAGALQVHLKSSQTLVVLLQVKNALTGLTLPAFLSNLASVRYERWGTAPKAHTEAGLTFIHVCF